MPTYILCEKIQKNSNIRKNYVDLFNNKASTMHCGLFRVKIHLKAALAGKILHMEKYYDKHFPCYNWPRHVIPLKFKMALLLIKKTQPW